MYNPEQNAELFHQAFSRHGDGLYYYVLKLTGDEEKAKDIVQECFLRFWENIGSLDTQSDLRPLLVTYIKNLLIDDFRKSQKRQQAVELLQANSREEALLPDVESRLLAQDHQRQLSASISGFSAKRQNILRLVRQGLSYSEVAQALNLSLPDVKKQMRISLQALRKALHLFFSLYCFLRAMLP